MKIENYGKFIKIFKITNLNLYEYNEKEITKLNHAELKKSNGLHHLSSNNKIVFDVRYSC